MSYESHMSYETNRINETNKTNVRKTIRSKTQPAATRALSNAHQHKVCAAEGC